MNYSKIFVIALSLFFSTQAFSDSGSESTSCSGHIKLCDDGTNNCSKRYYYIYSYQYIYEYNGEIKSESHSMSISGFLDGKYTLVGLSDKWVIYKNDKYRLALPWVNDAGIYAFSKSQIDGPGSNVMGSNSQSNWKLLCK